MILIAAIDAVGDGVIEEIVGGGGHLAIGFAGLARGREDGLSHQERYQNRHENRNEDVECHRDVEEEKISDIEDEHGKVVDTLLPVVALDDAVALILFALLFSLAKALSGGSVDLYSILLVPLMDIVLSLALGFGLGWLLVGMNHFFKSRNNRLIGVLAVLLGIAGISSFHLFPAASPLHEFQFSPLLAAMS